MSCQQAAGRRLQSQRKGKGKREGRVKLIDTVALIQLADAIRHMGVLSVYDDIVYGWPRVPRSGWFRADSEIVAASLFYMSAKSFPFIVNFWRLMPVYLTILTQ